MTAFIILTAEEADRVRGPGDLPDTMLEPRAINGGLFILPLAVLDDPAHATCREFLASLTQRELVAGDLPDQSGEDA